MLQTINHIQSTKNVLVYKKISRNEAAVITSFGKELGLHNFEP